MSHPILKTNVNPAPWTRKTWALMKAPSFMFRQLITIRHFREFDLLWRGLRSLLGHVQDYSEPIPEAATNNATTPQTAASH